jgi:hypothetical protein
VEDFTFLYKGFRVHMIDTPGFDDTNKSDTEILRDISDWLATSYRAGIKLSGILYLYDISSPRFTGSAKRNLQMFQELCGEDAFPCLVFGTTFWDKIEESRGERREKELQEHFWADMMKRGCHYIRHDDKRISAFKILDLMLSQRRSFTATIQKQLVDDKLDLHQTSAGQALSVDFRKLETEHQATLQKLHEEFQLAMERSDTTAAQKLASEQAKMLLQINEEKEAAKKLRVSRDQLEQEKKEENRKSQERYKAQLIEMNRLRKAQQGQQEFLERSETDREEIKRIVKNLEEDLRSAQRKKDCHKDPEGKRILPHDDSFSGC